MFFPNSCKNTERQAETIKGKSFEEGKKEKRQVVGQQESDDITRCNTMSQ